MKSSALYERITISFPRKLAKELLRMKEELGVSKSELIKIAFKSFLKNYKKENLKKIASIMKEEYENNSELTELTQLDHEDF